MSKQRGNGIDPWSVLATEELAVEGIKVRVRGLSYRELTAVTKPCKGDANAIAEALVIACVTRADGKEVDFATMQPGVFNALSEAVARVNGFDAGNSSATGADGSSTA